LLVWNASRVCSESMHMIAIIISKAPKPANNAARDPNRLRLCTWEATGVLGSFSVICSHSCPVVYSALPLPESFFDQSAPSCSLECLVTERVEPSAED